MVYTTEYLLASDDVEQVIARQSQATGQDRRSSARKRLHLTLTATLLTVRRLPQVQIATHDLSTTGIGFISNWAFTNGEMFVVPMRLADETELLAFCQVTSSEYVKGCGYRTGAKFLDSITTDELLEIPENWIDMAMGNG